MEKITYACYATSLAITAGTQSETTWRASIFLTASPILVMSVGKCAVPGKPLRTIFKSTDNLKSKSS